MNMARLVSVLFVLTVMTARAQAQLRLTVYDVTPDSITFSIGGVLTGSPGGHMNSIYIEAPGAHWIKRTTTSMCFSPIGDFDGMIQVMAVSKGTSDYIKLSFYDNLWEGCAGNSRRVTVCFNNVLFSPTVKKGSFRLYWGGQTDFPPFGCFQSQSR